MVFLSGMTGIKPGTQDVIDGGVAVQRLPRTSHQGRSKIYRSGIPVISDALPLVAARSAWAAS